MPFLFKACLRMPLLFRAFLCLSFLRRAFKSQEVKLTPLDLNQSRFGDKLLGFRVGKFLQLEKEEV